MEDTTTASLTSLLFLGLSLGLRNPVLAGDFFKPMLSVVPRSVVTTGDQVIFFCEGPLEAKEYMLYKEGRPDYLITLLETGNKAKFQISSVQWKDAGRYWCNYKVTDGRSVDSDFLELVVTGVYSGKLKLSVLSSPVIYPRANVSLECVSQQAYSWFIITKEDEKFSRPMTSQGIYPDLFGAQFTVGPITPNQTWRFMCYGFYWSSSQLWSVPSNHLELLVSASAPETQNDYTVENTIRMGMAGLVLVALGILVFESCHGCRQVQQGNGKGMGDTPMQPMQCHSLPGQ
ncbi:leukocyte immunoglobulin-like receptor subfamily A member 5 [Phodopus roborovskii]|uniref:leukocyte immunoglobulin-like receptor subfamily A member 5 n=1 Tax=Phodopus roborovskii TaxID=109678 RepID=UPI0021E4FB96|nr:leukocyte immunoglobulin-like receptor subfamily A member 5 [Phodopus roborovskii]